MKKSMKIILIISFLLIFLVSVFSVGYNFFEKKANGSDEKTDYYSSLQKNVEKIRKVTDFKPDVALVLGSGLGGFADNIDVVAEVSYEDLTDFPVSTVAGHEGKFIFGTLDGVKVVCMKGRVHYYEGYTMQQVTTPMRVMHMLGANTTIITNAVGAINTDFKVGDFMVVNDHISSFIPSPLIGENVEELGERFVDMTTVYDKEIISFAHSVADKKGITLHDGEYIQVTGPQFETPTEIKVYGSLGADTVGMSSVCESIVARHMGMRVCNINFISNMAAGISGNAISDEEVKKNAVASSEQFTELIKGIITLLK